MMLRLAIVQTRQRGVQRGGLARTGRAGDQQDAVRLLDQCQPAARACPRPCPVVAGRACRPPCRAGAAPRARRGRLAASIRARRPDVPPMRRAMRPSCGRRFSAMSSCAMILMREITSIAIAFCGASTSRSTPSMRKRTTEAVLERLDVDVAGAFLDRLGEQRVDHADDRRVVFGFEQVFGFGQFVGEGFQIHRVIEIGDHRARIVALLIQLAQQALEPGRVVAHERKRRAQIAAQLAQHLGFGAFAPGDFGLVLAPGDEGGAVALGETETRSWRMRRCRHGAQVRDVRPRHPSAPRPARAISGNRALPAASAAGCAA